MTPLGICVHNTANDASAKAEINYMIGNTKSVSFHIAVDDTEAWQGLPLDRNGWHAGDGSNGIGNRNFIGLEICYSEDGGVPFDKAEDNAAEVIAQLMRERGWTKVEQHVKKHQDFSGKYCPHRTLDLGWDRFINKIKAKLGGSMATELQIYLGVSDDTAAKVRLKEHLGEKDGKSNWGSEGDEGGYLGSERKLTRTLVTNQSGVAVMLDLPADATNDQILAAIKALKDQANPVPVTPGTPITGVQENIMVNDRPWTLNGINIPVDGKPVANYKRSD